MGSLTKTRVAMTTTSRAKIVRVRFLGHAAAPERQRAVDRSVHERQISLEGGGLGYPETPIFGGGT